MCTYLTPCCTNSFNGSRETMLYCLDLVFGSVTLQELVRGHDGFSNPNLLGCLISKTINDRYF